MSNKLVILDRDGVINQDSKAFVKTADEWLPLPGAIEAIAKLGNAGYLVAIATNQSGVGRGLVTLESLRQMHEKMTHLVEQAGGHIDAIEFCPHHPDDTCHCRKPLPGMLLNIGKKLDVADLSAAWMVGDSLRDLQAGEAAGARIALVLTGNGTETQARLNELQRPEQVAVFDSLAAFADAITGQQ